MSQSLPVVSDDLTLAIGGAQVSLTPWQGLTFAAELLQKSARHLEAQEAAAIDADLSSSVQIEELSAVGALEVLDTRALEQWDAINSAHLTPAAIAPLVIECAEIGAAPTAGKLLVFARKLQRLATDAPQGGRA